MVSSPGAPKLPSIASDEGAETVTSDPPRMRLHGAPRVQPEWRAIPADSVISPTTRTRCIYCIDTAIMDVSMTDAELESEFPAGAVEAVGPLIYIKPDALAPEPTRPGVAKLKSSKASGVRAHAHACADPAAELPCGVCVQEALARTSTSAPLALDIPVLCRASPRLALLFCNRVSRARITSFLRHLSGRSLREAPRGSRVRAGPVLTVRRPSPRPGYCRRPRARLGSLCRRQLEWRPARTRHTLTHTPHKIVP